MSHVYDVHGAGQVIADRARGLHDTHVYLPTAIQRPGLV